MGSIKSESVRRLPVVQRRPVRRLLLRPSAAVRLRYSVLPSNGRDRAVQCVAITCFRTGGVGQSGNLHTESRQRRRTVDSSSLSSQSFICLLFQSGASCACVVHMLQKYIFPSAYGSTMSYILSFSIFIQAD